MKKFIVLFISLYILSSDLSAQNYVIQNSRNHEPVEGVMCVYFKMGRPVEVSRSNFKGEIYFDNQGKEWDSTIFFKFGLKRIVQLRKEYTKLIYMIPIQNQIEEVVITGQIVPGNKYQSPFKIKWFTAEEIKNKNSVNLADFLQSENNFTVTQDPILGTKVAVNGMSGSDLKLLIDGIPVAGRLNGNIDYSQILLANVERIEFVDGPLSTIYGTNATGGVINLITKVGTAYESNVTAGLMMESVGVINANAYYNSTKNGHRVSLGLHRNVFLGWDPNADSLKNTIKPIWRDVAWNPKEQVMFNGSYYAPLSKKTNLHLKLNGFWETILNKLNPSSSLQTLVNDEYYKTSKYNIGGNSNTILSKRIEWQNFANVNFFSRKSEYFTQDLTKGIQLFNNRVTEDITNVFARTQFKHEIKNNETKLLYGADYNMDIGLSDKLDTTAKTVRDLSLYIMANHQITPKLLIQPGLRYSFNNIATTPLSGTANFRYELNKHFSLRSSFSRGYRIPELKELYFTFIDINHNIQGNPLLKTETNDNFQLGIDVVPNKTKVREKLMSYSSSLNFSYYNKSNAIDIVNINPTRNEFKYMNVGELQGLITNVDNRVKYNDYIFVLGGSLNGYKREFSNSTNQLDYWLFNWTMNANITYEYKKWGVKITSLNKYTSANRFVIYNLVSNQVEESRIPQFMYSDLNASKSFWNNKLNVTIGMKNVFNIQNLRVQGYSGNVHNFNGNNEVNNLWGRTLFTNITLNLNEVMW